MELLKARDLCKDLNLSKSNVALVKKHVCDVCVRSKISRSSHSGHLIHDDRICSTFAYDLQGPFNTPSIVKKNVYMNLVMFGRSLVKLKMQFTRYFNLG